MERTRGGRRGSRGIRHCAPRGLLGPARRGDEASAPVPVRRAVTTRLSTCSVMNKSTLHGLAVELTVVGSINLDLVARVERLPRAGETLVGHDFVRVPGGKGANQAVAAARLGARVRMIGAVGTTPLADEALVGTARGGVELDLMRTGTTGIALILVDDAGENQIVVVPGANDHVRRARPAARCCASSRFPTTSCTRRRRDASFFALNAAPARPVRPRARPADREPPGARGGVAREARRGDVRRRRSCALRERRRGRTRDAARGRRGRRHRSRRCVRGCLVVSLLEGRERGDALEARVCRRCNCPVEIRGAASLPTAADIASCGR